MVSRRRDLHGSRGCRSRDWRSWSGSRWRGSPRADRSGGSRSAWHRGGCEALLGSVRRGGRCGIPRRGRSSSFRHSVLPSLFPRCAHTLFGDALSDDYKSLADLLIGAPDSDEPAFSNASRHIHGEGGQARAGNVVGLFKARPSTADNVRYQSVGKLQHAFEARGISAHRVEFPSMGGGEGSVRSRSLYTSTRGGSGRRFGSR